MGRPLRRSAWTGLSRGGVGLDEDEEWILANSFLPFILPCRDTPMLNPDLGPLDCDDWDRQFVDRLCSLDSTEVAQFVGHIAETSSRTGLDYIKDSGERIIIPVTFAPVLFTPMILAGLRTAFAGLASAVAKVSAAWLDSPAVATSIAIGTIRSRVVASGAASTGRSTGAGFSSLGFRVERVVRPAADHFKLFEVNSVDVGGIHYSAATREVMAEALRQLGTLSWTDANAAAGSDSRKILHSALEEHSRQLGQPLHQVAIAENQDFTTGITEAESICQYFRKHALVADCVDVRKFEIDSQHKVGYAGHAVDVIYRNIEWRDLAELEAAGGDAAGLRAAAKAGKLMSSPFGELDHKSLWEVLGSTEFSDLFSPAEKNLIAKHIPWTRLLRERTTTDATGQSIELISIRPQSAKRFGDEAQSQLRRPRRDDRANYLCGRLGTNTRCGPAIARHLDCARLHSHPASPHVPRFSERPFRARRSFCRLRRLLFAWRHRPVRPRQSQPGGQRHARRRHARGVG